MVDQCQNQKCSSHGYCFLKYNLPYCKCFNGYNGDKCEQENFSVKIFHGVQISSILLCAIFVGFTVFVIISNDLWNLFIEKKKSLKKSSSKAYRFKYYTVEDINNLYIYDWNYFKRRP